MSLDPKPKDYNQLPKRTWEDLNRSLLLTFEKGSVEKPSQIITVDDYQMSKEEMIKEGELKGYKVSELSEGYLRFE